MTEPKRFVLLGHPVGHSVSPAIHGAAYRELGLPHRYEVVDCPNEAHVHAQVERLRAGELAGMNVTVPWKRVAFELCDCPDASAQRTGVVNVLALDAQGKLAGSNTDARALAEEIAVLHPAPRRAAVIGAGGAAQAAVVACQSLGIQEVVLSSRGWSLDQPRSSWRRAEALAALGAQLCGWPDSAADRRADTLSERIARVDVIIQATSAGMRGAGPGEAVSDWIPWRELAHGAVAIDVVYNPPSTPFLEAARRAQVPCAGGLGMLVRQAAAAIRIWLGSTPGFRDPDLGALTRAAEQALGPPRGA
ncbi:MAG: shikimate dehydrogenase [Deltaproteobacteria bacterium]